MQAGVGGIPDTVTTVSGAGAPDLGNTATCPPASTIVFPPGSGNELCKNQAGDPPSAGPRVDGCVCENAPVAMRIAPNAAAATPVKLRAFIFDLPLIFLV